jgi:radical SAM protein with 4Fe4S-binding SPASM domain
MTPKKTFDDFRLPLPPVMRIEPASPCNFRCRHCTTGLRMNKSLGMLKQNIFDHIFDRIKHLRYRSMVFYHAGEPLLNPNLFSFIDQGATISDHTKFVCNGSLLSDEKIEQILDSQLSLIEFSLDGRTAEENDAVRRGSNFEKITAQIYKLIQRKKERGSGLQIYISNIQFADGVASDEEIYPPAPPHIQERFADVLGDITVRSYYAMYWPGYPRKHPEELNDKPVRNTCDNIENTITIRWNGDVVACCFDLTSEMVLGNILESTLEEIWNGRRYLALRKAIHEYRPPAMCKGCNVICKAKYLPYNDLAA